MESKLEAELNQWKEREQRYEKLFSPSVLKSKEFLKEKLRHYDEIRARVIANPMTTDRIAMRAFQLERAQLAKEVYPNFFRRLLDNIIGVFKTNKQVAKIQQASASANTEIQVAMNRVGLGDHFKQVEHQMKQGNREFSLPVSYQVSEHEKMELQLNFKRSDSGKYCFESYKATLHSDLEKGKPRQHTFNASSDETYKVETAYNLLAGRAVREQGTNAWKQLDLNDKDGEGNLRVRHIAGNYGFDLENTLMALPIKNADRELLSKQLASGDKIPLFLEVNNKAVPVEISAHPLKKEIAIYEGTGQKVTLGELKNNTSQNKANVKQLVPEKREEKQVEKSKSIKL